jgi:hypothetical protein
LPNDPSFGSLWGLRNTGQSGGTSGADIDAARAWDWSTGDATGSVVVAVIDTGVDYTHPDLAPNMFRNEVDCDSDNQDDDGNGFVNDCYGYDFVNNDGDPKDDHDHGTHTAGTIGGVGMNALGVVGVNWQVKIMACKFLNAGGSGSTDGAIACLDYIARHRDRGVNVVATNNSWGGGGFSQALLDAIEAHRGRGILFVAAAGNAASDNDLGEFYPASYRAANVISVAATTRTDGLASFSNWGRRSVHLGAPGHEILSTTRNNGYSTFSGTSMATPHVAGVAALVKAEYPAAGWAAIRNRILAGGDGIGSMEGATLTGRRLNAYGALMCDAASPYPADPVVLERIRPAFDTVVGATGTPIDLEALHIRCATPNGAVPVTVTPDAGGAAASEVVLEDPDGDGIYTGQWTPPGVGSYTLAFPDGDLVRAHVLLPYSYALATYSYRAIAGQSLELGDDSAAVIEPGFAIPFGGGSFTRLFVSSNGNVNFTTPFTEWANTQLTTQPASEIGTLVAPFWDDLYPVAGSAQNVFWAVTGSPGSRELVVEWRDLRPFGCGDSTTTARFQAVFFEATSDVLFNYADTVFGGGCAVLDNGGSATVGVQTGPGQATTYSFNSPSLSAGMALLWTLAGAPPPSSPALSVTPASLDFGSVGVGTTKDLSFTVTNAGTGTLSGSASTAPPYSVVAGGSFSLGPGASQSVTVRFSPTSTGSFPGNVHFTSDGGEADRGVTGAGVSGSIQVLSPNGGESWRVKSNRTITWSSAGVTGNVKIEISRDGGSTWSSIVSSTANDGSYTWKATGPATTQARIRVCSVTAPGVCDTSDANFQIR